MRTGHARHPRTWEEHFGEPGTNGAIGLALQAGGHGTGEVNAEGLAWLMRKLFKLGDAEKIDFDGIEPSRRPIFPAGLGGSRSHLGRP